jgi:hypothetical protein
MRCDACWRLYRTSSRRGTVPSGLLPWTKAAIAFSAWKHVIPVKLLALANSGQAVGFRERFAVGAGASAQPRDDMPHAADREGKDLVAVAAAECLRPVGPSLHVRYANPASPLGPTAEERASCLAFHFMASRADAARTTAPREA